MLNFSPTYRVYLAVGSTDMRKSFNGLIALAEGVLQLDPTSGHLFAFCNKRRALVKLLFWDGTGFWVLAKRLERGRFAWPSAEPDQTHLELSGEQLSWILSGLDLNQVHQRQWWRRLPVTAGV